MKNKILSIVMTSIFFLLVLLNADSRSYALDGTQWIDDYISIICAISQNDTYNQLTYNLIYLDDNEIPELVVDYSGYNVSMYTYRDNKVVTLMSNLAYGINGNVGYQYFPRTNLIRYSESEYAGTVNYTYLCVLTQEVNHLSPIHTLKAVYSSGTPLYYKGNYPVSKLEYDTYCQPTNANYIKGQYTSMEVLTKLLIMKK